MKFLSSFVVVLVLIGMASAGVQELIEEYEAMGFDMARFREIYEVKDLAVQKSLFDNTTKLLEETITLYEKAALMQPSLLERGHDYELDLLMSLLKEGKYEEAKSQLIFVNSAIDNLTKESKHQLSLEMNLEIEGKDSKRLELMENELHNLNLNEVAAFRLRLQAMNESIKKLNDMHGYLRHFESENITTERLGDLYEEAFLNFERNRDERLDELHTEAEEIYARQQSLEKAEFEELNYEIKEKIYRFRKYYHAADFDEAERLLKEINSDILDFKSSQIKLDSQSPKYFIGYLKYLGYIIFFLLAIGLIFSGQIHRYNDSRKLIRLNEEKQKTISMIKKAQEQYYVHKSIPRSDYYQKLESYQKRLVYITKELALLKNDDKTN